MADMAAIRQQDWQQACLNLTVNWPGTANDGKTVAQRLDQAPAPQVTQAELDAALARIATLEAQMAAIASGDSEAAVLLRLAEIEQAVDGIEPRLWAAEP